jgi:predicted Zn-dependent protease
LLRVRHEAELGSPEAALAALDALEPSLAERNDLVMTRVQALTRLKRPDDVVKALEKLLIREPSNVNAALTLSETLGALNRPAAAREVLQRVRPFVTSTPARSALFQREAALWLQEERFPRALDALQTASRLEPTSAWLHYRLAEVYERMGSLHSAADEVRRGRLLDSPEGAKSRDEWLKRLENVGALPLE